MVIANMTKYTKLRNMYQEYLAIGLLDVHTRLEGII